MRNNHRLFSERLKKCWRHKQAAGSKKTLPSRPIKDPPRGVRINQIKGLNKCYQDRLKNSDIQRHKDHPSISFLPPLQIMASTIFPNAFLELLFLYSAWVRAAAAINRSGVKEGGQWEIERSGNVTVNMGQQFPSACCISSPLSLTSSTLCTSIKCWITVSHSWTFLENILPTIWIFLLFSNPQI